MRTLHRQAVDRFLEYAIPATPGLVGLHVGSGPSSTPRGFYRPSPDQVWWDVDCAALCSVNADVCALPFPSKTFDVLRVTECLYSIFDIVLALRECRRVLKPTGVLIATGTLRLKFPIDPHDLMRLTPYGWAVAFGRAGFPYLGIRELDGQNGYGLIAREMPDDTR